jgi:predicted dehydrogenase
LYQVGVIGLGQIAWSIDEDPKRKGIWSHAGAYEASEHTQLQAVSSRDESVCKTVQSKYSIPNYYTDYRAMLDGENLDVVSVCTPINTHHEIVMNCVEAGVKAIFCEKTLSHDIGEAEEMVSVCQERGIVLAVNFIKRWDSHYIHVYDLLRSGAIGHLQTIVAYGATALRTSTSHLIDMMCLYAGTPLWVVGDDPGGFVRNVHGVDDPGGVGLVKFDSGVIGFIKGSSRTPKQYMSELDILGEQGRIRITDDGGTVSVFTFAETSTSPGSGYESLLEIATSPPPENERMLDAVADIVDCTVSKKQPRSSGHSSLCSLKIIDGIRRSAVNNNKRICI